MRLFGKIDGKIDRFDRAGWLTMPFDLAFSMRFTAPAVIRRAPSTVTSPIRRAASESITVIRRAPSSAPTVIRRPSN
jgi:hypothetical protein